MNHFRAWEIWCTVARNAKEKETCRSASASLQPASNEKSMKRTNRITFQTIIWICQSYPSPPLTEVFPEESTHPCECHIFSKIQNSVESIHITKNICPTSCRVSGTGRLAGVRCAVGVTDEYFVDFFLPLVKNCSKFFFFDSKDCLLLY